TLLSSQGTDASFVLTLSGFPPGASLRSCCSACVAVLRFQPYQIRFPFRFRSEFISGGQLVGLAYLIAWWLSFGESDFIRSFRPA
ncbi:hypothetical protein ACFFS2_36495, partial [Streptomyces aurantiacus]|uniref:hypothetical protein n=1 Tax=Streptomyces aurantiacus TaxID=47760 RepID=UPI0035E9B418